MNNAIGVLSTGGDVNVKSETLEQCLKSTTRFGETFYQNICDGSSYIVPFGFWDFALIIILGLFGIATIILFLGMIFKVVFNNY